MERKGRRKERTKEMIRQFPKLRAENKSIREIADIFGLSQKTVYEYLQEIADFMGMSRDDLLYQVKKPHELSSNVTRRKAVEQVDTIAMVQHFSAMIDVVDKIILSLDSMLQEDEEEKTEDA